MMRRIGCRHYLDVLNAELRGWACSMTETVTAKLSAPVAIRVKSRVMQSAPSYPDWKAPAEDGKTLIWPDAGGNRFRRPTRIKTHFHPTKRSASAGFPLNELRR